MDNCVDNSVVTAGQNGGGGVEEGIVVFIRLNIK